MPVASQSPTWSTLQTFLLAAFLFAFATFSVPYSEPKSSPIQKKRIHAVSNLRCVRVHKKMGAGEGLGSSIRKNQLALFIASQFSLKLDFPANNNSRGYDNHDLFDDCTEYLLKDGKRRDCLLKAVDIRIEWCPRGDCKCLSKQVVGIMKSYSARGCQVLRVQNDGFKTSLFSGCLGDLLKRVFGTDSMSLQCKYDAVHYRKGDLADRPSALKSFQPYELYNIMREICSQSTRPIVVVTEGHPKVPPCGPEDGGASRIIMASDTSIRDAFRIMQHAKTVSTSQSSFATALLEVAEPGHVVIRSKEAGWLEWVHAEKWTVISELGAAIRFSSKQDFVSYASSSRSPRELQYRSGDVATLGPRPWSFPSRSWQNGMSC